MNEKIKSQFIEYFTSGIKEDSKVKIGVEHERFLFTGKDKKRIDYKVLKRLFENLKSNNWSPIYEGENVVGMKRGNQQITTEPGFQCELSGEPLDNIHQVCSENYKFFEEMKKASSGLNISTISIAFDPYNDLTEIPKSPKARYKIMTKEMPKEGKSSLDMMYRTCGIQVNFDYTSEKNFEKIFRLGNYLTPLSIGLYANSPFRDKKLAGFYSYRNKIWQNTSRGGIMPIAFENVTFEKYFDYVSKYPVLFIIRDKKYISPTGQNFQDFIEGKFENLSEKANLNDFATHLSTIFTEVRLKKIIELRSLDTCDWECFCDGPAFFTGLLYSSLDEAFNIIKKWKKESVMNAYLIAPEKGLDTELEGKTLYEWSKIFLKLSKKGLVKRKKENKRGQDESIYLKHTENVIKNKKNRAQLLIDKYNKKNNLDFFNNEKENFSHSGL